MSSPSINIVEDLPEEAPPLDMEEVVSLLVVPDVWHASFTDEDKENVAKIIKWLNAGTYIQSWLARASRINIGTFNQVLRGKYPSSPAKWIRAALDTMATTDERQTSRVVPFVDSCSVYRYACSVYHRVRIYRMMGVFISEVGTGKTRAGQEYRARYSNTLFIEVLPKMAEGALLDELLEQLSLQHEMRGSANPNAKFKRIVSALKGTDTVIILDEAEELEPAALEYARRIRDVAKIGVVLQGAPKLLGLVKPNTGRFNRIRSRIGFWPDPITSIDRRDAEEIILAAFPNEQQIDKAALDAMWEVCGGSARVLVEALIPSIRDYGLRRGRQLDRALVLQIAKEAIRMPIKAGGAK
ncbi:MAG: AAA family ATPase [Sinimarinibacterium flocculans]|jgi:DNA transposition AAA+ family ATPase|uniref:AAA family ATPase n=1 Tax=Sinimarinibacterium flocculans TaxID=985250 RepID=UPI003C5FD9FF